MKVAGFYNLRQDAHRGDIYMDIDREQFKTFLDSFGDNLLTVRLIPNKKKVNKYSHLAVVVDRRGR